MIDKLLSIIRLGRVTLVDDTDSVRRVQIEEGDFPGGKRVIDNIPHVQQFGHAGVPPIGSDVMLVSPCGDRSQTVAAGTNHKASRPRGLQPGDSALYDVRGARVQLTEDGLLIDCAGLPAMLQNCPTLRLVASETVTIDAPNTVVTGALRVDGTLTGDGVAVELGALRDAYNAHKHPTTTAGNPTGTTDHAV